MASLDIHNVNREDSACIIDDSPGISNNDEPASRGSEGRGSAWIQYSVEYRHRYSKEVLYQWQRTKEKFEIHLQGGSTSVRDLPALELVARYDILPNRQGVTSEDIKDLEEAPFTTSVPRKILQIHSIAIINALRNIVKYYPGQDLTGDVISVHYPYPILVHHYNELSEFRKNCISKDPSVRCFREMDGDSHIGLLLDFLDDQVMADVRAEKERNKNGLKTFAWEWVRWKPGTTILYKMRTSKTELNVGVVHSVTGGSFENPPVEWTVHTWNMAYDGTYLGRKREIFHQIEFDGEDEIENEWLFDSTDSQFIENHQQGMERVKIGEMYWNLLGKQCRYHKGNTVDFPYNVVSQNLC